MSAKKFSEAPGAYIFVIILIILAIYYSFISVSLGFGSIGGSNDVFIVSQIASIRSLILFVFAFLVWEFHIRKK